MQHQILGFSFCSVSQQQKTFCKCDLSLANLPNYSYPSEDDMESPAPVNDADQIQYNTKGITLLLKNTTRCSQASDR